MNEKDDKTKEQNIELLRKIKYTVQEKKKKKKKANNFYPIKKNQTPDLPHKNTCFITS